MHRLLGSLSTLACLTAAAAAQTGSYTTFGAGCPGTAGISWCESNNPAGGTLTPLASVSNPQLALVVSTQKTALLVTGFELFTQAKAKTTVPAWIYLPDSSGQPQASPLATGSITVDTKADWYRATFPKPVVISNQPKFFLSWSPGTLFVKAFEWPQLTTGTKSLMHWKDQQGTIVWKGPSAGEPWAWRLNCVGYSGNVPALSATGVPKVNSTFSVDLDKALPSTPVLLLIGASNSVWGPIQLPLDLTPAGAPGCGLLCSFDLPLAAQADTAGKSSFKLPVPNDTGLVNVVFHDQWIVLDPKANTLGLAFSNGGTGTIGR
ncbi:MAG: hypothetical protein R3F30_06325 [Planctomycetota bacterium]